MVDTEFIHSFDDLVVSVNVIKSNLKKVLVRNFVEGIDYTISKESSVVGRPKELIYMTKPCKNQLVVHYAITSRSEIPTSHEMLAIEYMKRYLPKETEILGFIKKALNEHYPCELQYHVPGRKYRIDLYFTQHNLAIECDEHDHKDRYLEYETTRQTEIQDTLQCKFFRFNPDSSDFCLGKLLSQIIAELKTSDITDVKAVTPKSNKMFDISSLDWFIWEDVDTAHVYRNESIVKMTEDDWLSLAINTPGEAELIFEVGRYADNTLKTKVVTPCTVRDLLAVIKDFYSRPIRTLGEISDMEDDCMGYMKGVKDKLRQGIKPMLCELNGTPEYLDIFPLQGRRNTFAHCNGLMRFEGLKYTGSNTYQVVLGS